MSTSRILIVEDEGIVALDMQSRLKRLKYQVVGIASTGEQALNLAGQHQPQLALMDIRLQGGMDGIETARQLRARYGIPVVYLTAYADEATLQRAKLTEPLGYLIKPFEERELYSTIEMALYKIEMETKFRTHAARLERVVSTVPEGVALLDDEFRVLLTNARAAAHLADLAGVSVGDILNRLGDYSIEQLAYAPDNESWHEINMAGASPRVFEAIVSPTQPNPEDLSHESSEWVLLLREVTSEREVKERIQLQDRLAAVGQFAAGIAHDFNNILASIILAPFLIEKMDPNLSTRSKERLRTIAQEAKRASDLIKQILDFSRASAMEMQPFDLRPLLKELAKMLDRILPDNVSLKLVYRPDTYLVNGDSTRILQLLMNLVLNARDAMPYGGELHIELAKIFDEDLHSGGTSQDATWIRISVSDNGIGIHPDALPHIFEPFFTTKAAGKGTGLGLAQVYGIVQQHGGYLDVTSALGQGTTFTAFLPALLPAAEADVQSDDKDHSLVLGQQQTILLVEDNAAARQSLSEILELSNYRVLTASNGLEALAILEKPDNQVSMILSDLVMPEMGGLDLSREIRRRNLPVNITIMTGYMSDDMLGELKSLAITDYLTKPITVKQLLQAVDSLQKTSTRLEMTSD